MPPRNLTPEHKQAMAAGRKEGASVKAYLDALEEHRPKRGRRRTADSIKARLAKIDGEMKDASTLKKLQLTQERRDLEAELAKGGETVDLSALEADFAKVAKAYGERKGIAYATWRDLGVPADVLKRAGVTRGG
jgi:predicted lipid-binding transport protein (Tim44 family)